MSLKRALRRGRDRLLGTEFERALRRAARRGGRRVLLFWNRGLGDIALGLCALFARIREVLPNAEITVITRGDLVQAFALTDADRVLIAPRLARGDASGIKDAPGRLGLDLRDYDIVFERPDPTAWLADRLGSFVPRLRWRGEWDSLAARFPGARGARISIAAHVSSETGRYYGYVKDWPAASWRGLFERFAGEPEVEWLLFGHAHAQRFDLPGIVDLRGETSFLEVLALIRNRARMLIAVDSGILTMAYYLDCAFALHVISLWSDPRQGILKQGVGSPNPLLRHTALVGAGEDVRSLSVDQVEAAVRAALASVANDMAEPAAQERA